MTSITRELIESGIVRAADRAPSRGGRPALLLEIVGRSAHAFGVKIAPDHLVGVVVDLDGDVSEQFEARLDLTAADGFDAAANLRSGWLDQARQRPRCSASASACRASSTRDRAT